MSESKEIIEKKPDGEVLDGELFGEMSPELAKQLEAYIGETLEKLFNPKLAIMSGELTLKERACLNALYTKSNIFKGRTRALYRKHIYDYMLRSVPYKRQRAQEVVSVLRSIQEFKRITFGQRIREALGK